MAVRGYGGGMAAVRMVLLATLSDGFEAKCLAARLGAEGVLWQLRGGVDGVYPLGTVDLLVDADDLDVALEVLTCVELGSGAEGDAGVSRLSRHEVALLGVGALGLASLVAARVLVLG